MSDRRGRRDLDRADGFASRAWEEGNLADYRAGLALRWQVEDRARERRARTLTAARNSPGLVVLAALAVLVVVLVVVSWVADHPVLTVAGVVAGVAALRRSRRSRPRRADVDLVAPHDVRRPLRLDPLTTALPGDARAVVDALDPGRSRLYLQALTAGLVPAPTRSAGAGLDVVEVPLPGGRIAPSDVDLRRFAQTLGIDPTRVRRGRDVPGVLVVEVLHVAPADRGVGPWPMLGAPTSWSDPMPLGVDDVGRPVSLDLAGRRVLVVGQSGSGKSRLARTIALHAASDPRVELHVADFKGSPSLRVLRGRAAWLHQGPATDDVVEHLRGLVEVMRTRYRRMIDDGVDVVAADGWVVLVMDEVQALWRRREAVDLVEELARMGREAGVGLVLASQLPDKASMPTAIAEQADVRVCLRVSATWAAGLVLGDYGVDAASLPPGHAWMNAGAGPVRVATHDVGDADAAAHLESLPALPPGPSRPVLDAVGWEDLADDVDRPDVPLDLDDVEGPDDDVEDVDGWALLADVDLVLGGRAGISWEELAAGLERDVEELREELRAVGVKSSTVRPAGSTSTVRGVRRSDVERARAALR